jgi:hypothetical protein
LEVLLHPFPASGLSWSRRRCRTGIVPSCGAGRIDPAQLLDRVI